MKIELAQKSNRYRHLSRSHCILICFALQLQQACPNRLQKQVKMQPGFSDLQELPFIWRFYGPRDDTGPYAYENQS